MSSIALFRNQKYSQNVRSRGGRERVELQRFFSIVVLVLLALFLIEILFHFFVAPTLVIDKVVIQADEGFPYSNSEVLEMAGIRGGSYFFDVDTTFIAARLEQVPIVRRATVTKHFPHSLTIAVEERNPLSVLMVMGEKGMVPAYVDSEGVIFRSGRQKYVDLPVLSGIEVPSYKDGMQLPTVLSSFLSDLERLRSSNTALYRLISEVKFVKKNKADYEVVLYPSHYPVRVRIGPSLTPDLMKYILLVLDVVSDEGILLDIDELDFRTNEVVYRVGEK